MSPSGSLRLKSNCRSEQLTGAEATADSNGERCAANAQVTLPAELESWAGTGETWYGMAVVTAKPDGGPYSETVDGISWTFCVSNGMAVVSSRKFGQPSVSRYTERDIAIPSRLGNCEVTGIGEWALRFCERLASVSIPEGVTSIGGAAFAQLPVLHGGSGHECRPPRMIGGAIFEDFPEKGANRSGMPFERHESFQSWYNIRHFSNEQARDA